MKRIVLALVLIILCVPLTAFSQPTQPGGPFAAIQKEINSLKAQVSNLQDQIDNLGITRAVHGYRFMDGTDGTGFTSTYDSVKNVATLHFDPPFPGIPHCFAMSDNPSPAISCLAVATSSSTADVTCFSMGFINDPSTGYWEHTGLYGNPVEVPFLFICAF